MTSPICEKSRKDAGQPEGKTIIELNKVIGDSFQVIVDGKPATVEAADEVAMSQLYYIV